jgi:SAM-dependent methyltransferase
MPSEADRIISLYERNAHAWDKDRGGVLLEKTWMDRFLALLPQGASILDLGCGSGRPIARYLVDCGHSVTGVDSSPSLIDICRGRFPQQEWVVADMRTLRLERTFGGVLAWDSFFHLAPEDQRSMFPIFKAHAAPGAPLMFTSGPAAGQVIATYRGEPLYHGSLDEAEYRALLEMNGFGVAAHVVEDPTCGEHTVWLAQAG